MNGRSPDSIRRAVAKAYGVAPPSNEEAETGERQVTSLSVQHAAESAGISIHEDAELLALLTQLDLDEQIPSEVYDASASVICWIQEIRGEFVGIRTKKS